MTDVADRVTGRMRYAIDVELPGMTHAALVRSTAPAGRLVAVDASAARALPGIVCVATGRDLVAAGLGDARFGTMVRDQPILAVDRVRFVGEPVAAVVAETVEEARAAASLIGVDIEPETAVFDPDEALTPGAALVHGGRSDNILGRWGFSHGDLESARTAAAHHFRHEFWSPAAQQASLEPHVCVARWSGGSLEVWSTSQNPSRVAEELARLFELDGSAVRLRVPPLGGAYGGKNHAKLEPLVAFLARLAGRPVRLANRRVEEFVTVTKHPARVLIESGLDARGSFLYRSARLRWSGGAYALSSLAVVRAGALAVCGPYKMPAAEVDSVVAYTNLPPAGSFRGLGVNQVAWAGEQQVDIIAAELGIDPIDFRRRNLVRRGDRLPTGEPAGDAHWLECLEAAVAGLGPPAAEATPAVRSIARGRGVAVIMKHTITPSRSEAAVALRADGTVEVRTSAVDMGQGLPTVLARLAGRALRLPLDRIVVVGPDTAVTPFDVTTSSSRATFAVGEAVERAAGDLIDGVVELAGSVLAVPPDRIRYEAGLVIVAATGAVHAVGELLGRADRTEIVGHGAFVNEPALDSATGMKVSSSHWHQGALAVEVSVDPETGVIRAERAHGAAWAGRVVSAIGARLQNEGNVIFGLGPALFEQLVFDDGRARPDSLLDYRLPSIADVPAQLTTEALEAPATEMAERHGLGESLIPAVAPAIGNAVTAAVGVRLFDLPLLPERVWRALALRRSEGPAASARGSAIR